MVTLLTGPAMESVDGVRPAMVMLFTARHMPQPATSNSYLYSSASFSV